MNIYTPASGLFDTHVTWEDIEEEMQRVLDTNASFGPNKTARNIGEGKGVMSIIALIEPDWQRKDRDLPDKFAVKMVTALALQRVMMSMLEKTKNMDCSFVTPEYMAAMEYMLKRFHNTEVTVYSHLMKLPEGKVPLVKIYSMKKFSESNPLKGYIVMEYVDHTKMIHIYENVEPKALKKVLQAKAVMEAMSLKFTQEEKEEFTEKPFSELFAHLFRKDTLGSMITMLRQLDDGKLADNADRFEEIFPDHADLVRADRIPDELGMQRVLCHGDLWAPNILWKSEQGDIAPAALIDFQNGHMGSPANDLVRLFTTCLSGKDRREHWEELLEEFYGYLKEETADLKLPYTLEQLKESYRQFMPFIGFLVVIAIGSYFELLSKDVDEEQKKKTLKVVMEKTTCLLDDVLHYHDRNMKLRKEEQTA